MKKTTIFIFPALFILLSFSGCKKSDSVKLTVVEFTVQPSGWYAFGNLYGHEEQIPEITENALANGSIVAYYAPYQNSGWTPLPAVRTPGTPSIGVAYSNGQASLGYYDLDQTTDAPSANLYFKLVITTQQ